MAYNPYEMHPPQGYLDRRPSYDDHYCTRDSYAGQASPHPVFEEDELIDAANLNASGGLPGLSLGADGAPVRWLDHYSTRDSYAGQLPPHAVFEDDELIDAANLNASDGLPGLALGPDGAPVRWRDPDLHEVVEFLSHPSDPVVKANAAAYLQHLCFMDDNMKQKTRSLGGIPPLINLLNSNSREVGRNACGALRNLSYGRQNDENKRAIRNAGGIPALVNLLRKSNDGEIRELVTGILWNLSSCEDIKRPIIDDGVTVLVNHIIIPCANADTRTSSLHADATYGTGRGGPDIYWSTVFRNASGVLRNVSSAGEFARRKLRECDGLVEVMLHLVRSAIGKNDMDNKSIENCVCILRNLSYRCQEIIDPEYDKHPPSAHQTNSSSLSSPSTSRAAAIMGSVGSKVNDNLGCFGASKKKKDTSSTSLPSAASPPSAAMTSSTSIMSTRQRSEPARGMELLWQPEVVQPYLSLLSECSNPETLEAAAGAIQNLAACYWEPSIDIRAAVRKEKGLPVLVELLRMEVDRVVCAVATALRNLAMDQRNKELIGKYAMRDLVSKLPNGSQQHDSGTSDDTVAAVLATLNEVISKNGDFAKSLLEADGMERLMYIIKSKAKFSQRVYKFTSQLLFNMWQHVDLREFYRKAGYKESNFIVRPIMSRNNSSSGGSLSPGSSANNTLSRPMSTQGATKYEDRTLPRGTARNNSHAVRPEELPLNDISRGVGVGQPDGVTSPGLGGHSIQQQQAVLLQQQQRQHNANHRPPVGGVQIYPPGAIYGRHSTPLTEPLYAQVNRDRKQQQQQKIGHYLDPGEPSPTSTSSRRGTSSSSTQLLLNQEGHHHHSHHHNDDYLFDADNEPIYPPLMPAGDSWV